MYESTPIFEFNSRKSTEFDLILCKIDASGGLSEGSISGVASIIETTLPSRWRPIFYGTSLNTKLEFEFSFGLIPERYERHKPLTRAEIANISAWLTGHSSYLPLKILDGDLSNYVFKCVITELNMTGDGNEVWGMVASVTCDSPYAYLERKVYTADATENGTTITIENLSGLNQYYYPRVEYISTQGGDLEITNKSDKYRVFKFTGLPAAATNVIIDNENQVITNTADINIYDNFNYKFFRMVPGENILTVKGDGIVVITCEYPVNIGGYIN